MLRKTGGVIGGVIAWFLIANVGNHALRVTWPGYSEVEVAETFTLGIVDRAARAWGYFLALRGLRRRVGHQPENARHQIPCWPAACHVSPRHNVVGTLSPLVSHGLCRLSPRDHATWRVALSPPQETTRSRSQQCGLTCKCQNANV